MLYQAVFFCVGLYHAVHVPLLSLTCGTSSTCRVWHSFVIRVETLAFIRKINQQWYYTTRFPCSSISGRILPFANMWDVNHPGPLAMHAKLQGSHPGHRAAVTMTNEPSNHRPTSHFEVAWTKEPSWLRWIPLLEENYCTSNTASYSSYYDRGLLSFIG